ncbi:hypothetical protein RN001_001473 [Aquatica leii]|uniref:SDE2-like domain-containing protein n=1 Tax=Aquatica leii TaxID=1421715 RepID=A0AAN7Q7W0_9COLE|nr:hypothetical protein RN001_001473 [Aquatica leii]
MLDIYFENIQLVSICNHAKGSFIKTQCASIMGIPLQEIYLTHNGKLISNENTIEHGSVHVILRQVGGKGGFGSMLRAIGAQIEKTTNREACRDLSGRRLRDINEEKRLKTWITQQVDREKEAAEHKQKKLERLCEKPKHEFKDEVYDKERSVLLEKVEDAVIQGLKASSSTQRGKRKQNDTKNIVRKKKPKLWFDGDEELDTSDEATDEEEIKTITKNSTEVLTQ